MSLSAMDLAWSSTNCKHRVTRVVSAPADFECDVCGLQPTSTFLMFREHTVCCDDCGMMVHEKCLGQKLTPPMRLYALTRRRERRASDVWKTSLLPELKSKHAALELKIRGMNDNLKKLRVKVDESQWNRSWALRTFATSFYGQHNPEKTDPAHLTPLIAYYSKTPARCRLFFERLATSYPEHKVKILVELANLDLTTRKDESELNELETMEASAERLDGLKDELQREISFPMNPAMGVAPKWRLRLSVDGTTVAMGDFFLEHLRARLRVSAGVSPDAVVGDTKTCFVKVEIIGLEANKKATFSASLSRFGLAGPSLPVNYSADTLALSFECAFQMKAEYTTSASSDPKKKGTWKVAKEGTSCVVSNLRHAVEGASIPIPGKVLDLALESLLTYGLKNSVLAILPFELGEYIVKFNRQVCNVEWRIKLESLVTREVIKNTPLAEVVLLERMHLKPKNVGKILSRLLKKISPRPTTATQEVWTLSKLMELHRRYIKEAVEREQWSAIWNQALQEMAEDDGLPEKETTALELFQFIEKLDSKPCSIEIDCLACSFFFAVRDLSRVVRGVLLRAVSSKTTTSLELHNKRMSGGSDPPVQQQPQQPPQPKATAQQARTAVYEVCSSFEQAVESALSHAVRQLRFSLELDVAGGLLSLKVAKIKIISKLGEEFEAPIPAQWIGDRLLQSSNEVYPWKNTFAVDAHSGALKFVFLRENEEHLSKSFGDLILQLAEMEVRIAFDGLVQELLRKQRQSLFGKDDAPAFSPPSSSSSLFAKNEPTTSQRFGRAGLLQAAEEYSENPMMQAPSLSGTSSPKAAAAEKKKMLTPHHESSETRDEKKDEDDTFIMMRVGYMGNVGAVAKGLGNPRIETSVRHLLLNGPFSSLIRLLREFRLGKSAEDKDVVVDEVDALLEKMENKFYKGGSDQRLVGSILWDLSAIATPDSDLHVTMSLPLDDPRPALTFIDDLNLISFVSEVIQFVG